MTADLADPDTSPRLADIIARHLAAVAFLVPGCPPGDRTHTDPIDFGELIADACDHIEASSQDHASILTAALTYLCDGLDATDDTTRDVLLTYADRYLTGSDDMDGVEDMARKLATEYGLSYPDGAVLHDQAQEATR